MSVGVQEQGCAGRSALLYHVSIGETVVTLGRQFQENTLLACGSLTPLRESLSLVHSRTTGKPARFQAIEAAPTRAKLSFLGVVLPTDVL